MREDEKKIFLSLQETFETYLQNTLDGQMYPLLKEACAYSLLAPGKRVRPMLLLLCGKALNLSEEVLLPWAAALEMIHCSSLIHDDLPALDNDDYRRGRLTNHKVYGEGQAVLAGDALEAHAMLSVSRALAENTSPETAKAQTYFLESALGMLSGQSADLFFEKKEATLSDLQYIEHYKTGCLLTAPLVIAGILAGVTEERQERLQKAGFALGSAFQIYDDILDVQGSFEELGKSLHKDEQNGKATFVTCYGLEKARSEALRLTEEAVSQLGFLGGAFASVLISFVKDLILRNN